MRYRYIYKYKTGLTKVKTRLAIAFSALALVGGGTGLSLAILGTTHALGDSTNLFGNATIVPTGGNPGHAAQIVSDVNASNNYGGVDFAPTTPVPWTSLTSLSLDYNVTSDNCGGGSPRVVLGIDTNNDNTVDGYVAISLGPSPNFTGCAPNTWLSSGNLIGNNDVGRYDYSQGLGGSQFSTYSAAPSNVTAGNVVDAFVVVDGYWSDAATGGDGVQTVLVDNINFNGTVYDFETVLPTLDTCKNGGWKQFTNPSFKNQGQCVSYAQHTNGVGQDDTHAKAVRQ